MKNAVMKAVATLKKTVGVMKKPVRKTKTMRGAKATKMHVKKDVKKEKEQDPYWWATTKQEKEEVKKCAKKTDAQLVHSYINEFHFTQPNAVECEIEKRNKFFMQSGTALVILKEDAGKNMNIFRKLVLEKVQKPRAITQLQFRAIGGWSEEKSVDFKGFSVLCRKFLPNVRKIKIEHIQMKNFVLENLPKVVDLELEGPQPMDGKFCLKLQNLKRLEMNYFQDNASGFLKNFGESIKNCPKIEKFSSRKLTPTTNDGHIQRMPILYLPNCKTLYLERGDCLQELRLYIPRLKHLSLSCMYELGFLSLLKQGHKDHKRWNVRDPTKQSRFALADYNSLLGNQFVAELTQSGRCSNAKDLGDVYSDDSSDF